MPDEHLFRFVTQMASSARVQHNFMELDGHYRALLGGLPRFRDLSTWRAWLAFLRAVYGLPMDAQDLALFQEHTGRTEPRPGGYPEAVAITGRQSGKSAVAATVLSARGPLPVIRESG